MSNRYSTFPDALDELKLLSEVQEMTPAQKQKVARYTELALKDSFTSIEEVEFQNLYQALKEFQLNSSDWNKVVETVMNTQKYIKEKVMGDIGILIDNAEVSIGNTVIAAKGEINTLKANTFVELAQKVSQIVSDGVVGIDFFKGRSIASGEVSSITISVPQYNKSSDFLMVHINGALVSEGINYTIGTDGYSIKSIGGTWAKGTVFDFIVLKKTIVLLENYDAGLFEDGSIRKEKLTVALQEEISKVNEVETNLAEFKTITNTSLNSKVPTVRTINNKSLSSNITLTSGDVGAVPTTRKINNKVLSSDIILTPSDIGSPALLDGLIKEENLYKIGDLVQTANLPGENWIPCDGRFRNTADYISLTTVLGNKVKRDISKGDTVSLTINQPGTNSTLRSMANFEFFKGYLFLAVDNSIYRSSSLLHTLVVDSLPSGYSVSSKIVNFDDIAICRGFYKTVSEVKKAYIGFKTSPTATVWNMIELSDETSIAATYGIDIKPKEGGLLVTTSSKVISLNWNGSTFVIDGRIDKATGVYVHTEGFFWHLSTLNNVLTLRYGKTLSELNGVYFYTSESLSLRDVYDINRKLVITSLRESTSYMDFYTFDMETFIFEKYESTSFPYLYGATTNIQSVSLSKDTTLTTIATYGTFYYTFSQNPFSKGAVWRTDEVVVTGSSSNYMTQMAFDISKSRVYIFGYTFTSSSSVPAYYIPIPLGAFRLPLLDYTFIKYK